MVGRSSARRLARETVRRGAAPVATRAAMMYSSLQPTGNLQATYRSRHVMLRDVPGIRLVYANRTVGTSTDGADGSVPNAITVKASVTVGGVIYPLSFGGRRSVTLDVDGEVLSDPFMLPISAGTEMWVLSNVSVADTTMRWPLGVVSNSGATESAGGGKSEGRKLEADTTATGVYDVYTAGMYHPISIRAAGGREVEAWAGFGDSLLQGYNATVADASFAARAFRLAGVPFVNLARTAETADGFPLRWRRNALAAGCAKALVHYGTNDLYGAGKTLQATKNALALIVSTLAGMGMTPYVCTLSPRTTSTDGWLTTGNQTVGAAESNRLALNAWILSGGLAGAAILDTAALVEASGGKWIAASVLRSGTATGGTTGTLLDSGIAAPSYALTGITGFDGCLLRMTSGANNGQTRTINSGNAGSVSFATFSSAVAAGDTYDILEVATLDGIHPSNRSHQRMMGALPLW